MKKILSFMCFFGVWLVVLTGLISVNALSENDISSSSDQITVQLLSRERVDYSQIVLKVYSAEKDLTSELAPGLVGYKESLAFEVNFNSAGIAEFTKPSEYFSVSIKLESLPLNFGVISHTYFFHNHKGTTKHTFQLERVERVSLEENQGSLGTVLKDKNGVVVFADTDFTKIEADSYNIDEIKNEVTITDKYIVGFSGRDYIFYDTNVHNFSNEVNRYKFLCGRNIITYDEYIKSVSDYLSRVGDTNPERVDKYELRREIERYHKTTTQSELTVSQNTEASEVEVLLTSNNYPYHADSQSGRFIVRYNMGAFPSDCTQAEAQAIAQVVANEFDSVDSMFYGEMGFLRPYNPVDSSVYVIYLESDDNMPSESVKAKTVLLGTEGSNITVSYSVAKNIYDISNGAYIRSKSGILAHEYMHGILYRYGYTTDSVKEEWFQECIANWAAVVYEEDFAIPEWDDLSVETFLNSYDKPLYYFEPNTEYAVRHYGSFFILLFIDQELGGYDVIRKILSFYELSYDPIEAIESGLSYYGYDLASVFAECAAYNSEPQYFYYSFPNAWQPPDVDDIQSFPYYSSDTQGIQDLSCNYFPFVSPGTVSELTVTIDCFPTSGGIPKLYSVQNNGNYKYTNSYSLVDGRYTVFQSQFGLGYAEELLLVLSNGGTSGLVNYNVSATLDTECIQVTFDANGGYCDTAYKFATPGGTYGQLPIPTLPGYTFVGWWDKFSQESYEITSNTTIPTNATNHTICAHWAKTYKITNVGAGKCLNIYGDNVTWLYNGQNVTLWSDSGTNEQKWLKNMNIDEKIYLRSVIDRSFGLNVYRAGDPYNCNVYTVIGNEIDAQLDLIPVDGGYKIRLVTYDYLYLTAGSSEDGANVYWAPESSSNYQKWTLTEVN